MHKPRGHGICSQETTYVAGLHGRSGDPSPRTARGVFRAMQAAAGGIIGGCCMELMGWDQQATKKKIDAIYDTILRLFELGQRESIPPYAAADKFAEQRSVKPA